MATYQPNFGGFAAMAVGPEMVEAVRTEAERAKAVAEAMSEDFRVTGEYADSFEVTSEFVEISGHLRAAGRLTNTAPYAAAVEWGDSHDRKPHRVLGRTLLQLND